jgi:hypothetical protein
MALAACTPDTAHAPIFLAPPYDALPPARAGTAIEPGRPVDLNGRQQESVVVGVLKWMKDPLSVQFSGLAGTRNSRSLITVCGQVNGRTTAGRYIMSPFVGVLMGPGADADFVLVGIGSSERDRAEVTQLCRASGIFGVE